MGKATSDKNPKKGLQEMIRFVIWITLPSGEQVSCGEAVCSNPESNGRITGAFRYTAKWLNHPNGFALDPNELPLADTEYVCDRPQGVFSVFEDSLPDYWGRRLLIRKAGLDRDRQNLPNLLLALNGNALGALSYYTEALGYQQWQQASLFELESLVNAALSYEAGETLENSELTLLFTTASSPGGARPKALIQDGDGNHWLAKFPSTKDEVGIVPIEAATMALAKKAGLNVPVFKIQQCGKHKVLLVRRFDLSKRGGRRHMISFQTLMQAQGHYTLGYLDLLESLRRISDKPAIDIPALYRQMVFNALIGNTDDHLKNFCMLHDDSGYYLSPAYDLLPDTVDRREHVLHFCPEFYYPGPKKLVELGRQARISGSESIFEEVKSALLGWKQEYKRWQVANTDIRRLTYSIENRLAIPSQ
jgi:serine/threonine-protein kinase HipA